MGVGQVLLAEGQLADGPDLSVLCHVSYSTFYDFIIATYGLQGLLDLSIQGTGLERDDLWSGIGVVGDRRATIGAEEAVDSFARRADTRPFLNGAVDSQLVLKDHSDKGYPS